MAQIDLFVKPFQRIFLDIDGEVAPGAKLYFYETGTQTLKDTFSDAALTAAHTNPVIANSAGQLPAIYLQSGYYKVICHDQDGALQWTHDPVGTEDGSIIYLQIANNLSDVQDAQLAIANLGAVPDTRTIHAGDGLSGGGPLSSDVYLSLTTDVSQVEIIAGTGLTGGGPLTDDVTLNVDFATQEEVDEGVLDDKAVSPATLKGWAGVDEGDLTNVYTDTDIYETDFPIGHILGAANEASASLPLRNRTAGVFIGPAAGDDTASYSLEDNGQTRLTGTWASRGRIGSYTIMQRIE